MLGAAHVCLHWRRVPTAGTPPPVAQVKAAEMNRAQAEKMVRAPQQMAARAAAPKHAVALFGWHAWPNLPASPTPAAHPALELDSSLTGAENSVPPHVRQAAAGRAYKARARADAARADAATRAADACATELRAVKAELERLRHARDERVETQHVARVGNVRVLVEAASHCRVRLRIVPAD